MSSLNFIGGEKGGVGKSVVARVLAQYFIDSQQPFTGFDTDRSHTTFTRFYQSYASPVIVDSLRAWTPSPKRWTRRRAATCPTSSWTWPRKRPHPWHAGFRSLTCSP